MILGFFSWLFGDDVAQPRTADTPSPSAPGAPKPEPQSPAPATGSHPNDDHVILPGGKSDRLGEILLKYNIITPEKLQKALAIQASLEHPKFLGEILIDEKMLTEDELVSVVSRQFKIPYININKYGIDREILRLIPEQIVREALVLPISKMGRELTVGMVNPQDQRTVKELENLTGCEIKIVLCKPAEIKAAIEAVYRTTPASAPAEPPRDDGEYPESGTAVISTMGVPFSKLMINPDADEAIEGSTDVVNVTEMPVRRSHFTIKGAQPPDTDAGENKK
ncbi:MAG: hypothetical protein V1701_02145 [Planctomycetota bacterium]